MCTIQGEERVSTPTKLDAGGYTLCSANMTSVVGEQDEQEGRNDVNESILLTTTPLFLPGGGENCSVSEQVYIDSGNEKKILFLLCIGLRNHDNEQPLFSLESEPWSLLPKTTILRPKNSDYVKEITRRATLFNIAPLPRPSNWTRVQTLEWLEQNPVRVANDIEFLSNEVARLQDVLRRAQQQNDGENGTASSRGGGRNWRGPVPYLCMIMCLTQDNVKCLFLARANTRSRQELDARNSESR